MRGISRLAIVVGGVCDVVLSALLGIPLMMHVISGRGLGGVPKEQIQGAAMAAIHGDPVLYAAELGIGFGCSMLGGFIAASIAKQRRILNGVLAAWLCVAMGLYSLLSGQPGFSVVVRLGLIAATPACYWVGAILRARVVGKTVA